MPRWIWIALVPALAAGCSKKEDPGPPCGQVADHVTEVVAKAYPGHADMMPKGARKQWVASCESRKLTAKQRRCMMDAQTPDALAACIREKVDEKQPGTTPLPGATPAPSAVPPAAPAPSAAPPATPTPAPSAAPPATPTPAPSAAPPATPTPPAAPAPAAPAAPAPAAPAPAK
jgi:hypothetical protein